MLFFTVLVLNLGFEIIKKAKNSMLYGKKQQVRI